MQAAKPPLMQAARPPLMQAARPPLIQAILYPGSGQPRTLLLMLPAAGCEAEDFSANGLVAALQSRMQVEIAAVKPDLAAYLEDGPAEALHRQIIEPALARGIVRIWLLGISLGGMGALLYAAAHPGIVERLFLLAPFLGTKGTIAELAQAGGLLPWHGQNSAATRSEQRVLCWLQTRFGAGQAGPELHLGYGLQDRFAAGHKILASHLPADHVVTAPGGHDWGCWLQLWESMLARLPVLDDC